MKVLYLTRVDIGSNAAQARQIQSMGRAFFKQLGSDFLLFSSGRGRIDVEFPHQTIPFSRYRSLRYLSACAVAAMRAFPRVDDVVFTRDIMVAVVVLALGGSAIYEAHNKPRSSLVHYLFYVLARLKRFRLLLISDGLKQFYQGHYQFPVERVLTAHDGVFPEEYCGSYHSNESDLKKELSLPLDKKIIVHTGSLYKGGWELFGYLADEAMNTFFVQVGGTSEECEKLKLHYLSNRNMRFISHVDTKTVRKYQAVADVLFYVATTDNEMYWCTSPLKIFEYMANRKPILSSNIGSITEVLSENNSFLYDPYDQDALVKTLMMIIQDGAGAALRAENAYIDAMQIYTWQNRVSKILDKLVYL